MCAYTRFKIKQQLYKSRNRFNYKNSLPNHILEGKDPSNSCLCSMYSSIVFTIFPIYLLGRQ